MYSLTVEHSLLCKAQMIPQMRDGNPTASVQRICRQLPLPLGEGRGEGLLMKPKILLSPFCRSGQEKGWRRVFFSCYSATPLTLTLSQRERVFTYKILSHWTDAYKNRLSQRPDD